MVALKIRTFALCLWIALLVLHPSFVLAQSSTFRLTGSLQTPRLLHTATLLPSGKVLVAGGLDTFAFSNVAAAELYDPLTGSWASTGSMNIPRNRHTVTLLPNGKVLVVGGDSSLLELGVDYSGSFLASAELYDPATGTWSPTGSLNTPRKNHTATLLPSGKVLVVGGRSSRFTVIASAELYDPATGAFTPTGSLNTPRLMDTATLLLTGEVLVAGGGDFGGFFSSAELYDPVTGTWAFTGSLNTARGQTQATRLNDGRVLIAGGGSGGGPFPLQTAELYDPVSGTFSVTGSLNVARQSHTLTLLSDGKALTTGGFSPTTGVFTSAELYDSTTQTWSAAASMNVARYLHTATVLPSGEVLVAGGFDGTASLASADLFGPVFQLTCSSMHTPRLLHTATLLHSGKVLVAGGLDTFTFSNVAAAELYDPLTGSWTPTGSMNIPRNRHTATLLPNGKVLVVGGDSSLLELGVDYSGNFLASAELYDPATGTWSPTGSLNTPRKNHTATLLPSGKVLVVGGRSSRFTIIASAELYDPATETFTPTASLNTPRLGHTATLLLTGKVLVAGGSNLGPPFSSAELYDPATETWAFTGSLINANDAHRATLLHDGRVLIAAGGDSGGPRTLQTAELYDPTTGTFSATGSLNVARKEHTLTLLSDGKALTTGGISAAGVVFASAELYDSMTQTWSATASMNIARYVHTATVLPSGDVLVAGGFDGTNSLASAEVFGFVASPNCPPVVGALSSAPAAVGGSVLIATGSMVAFSAPWTDPNASDTHTARCDVVDVFGIVPSTSVSGSAPGSGSGTATCTVTFSNTGIFSVTMTVTDQNGASGTSTALQVVVYDPSAGFVTGGGWFTPDPQTCVCTPGSKATFGLVTKYQKGATVPTGNQEFQYKVDNITLHSTSFDWLVVSGPQAQFQGTGTINGAGNYRFRVTVRDGDHIGQPDRFEIRILPAGSTDFGGSPLWKGGNDLTGSNGAGSIVIHQ